MADPAVVPAAPFAARARALRSFDGATLLTVYVVLLLGIPAGYVFGPLGAAGTPARIFGLFLLLWWVVRRLLRTHVLAPTGWGPRHAGYLYLFAVLLSFIAAMTRPIIEIEASAASRGLITIGSWLGVILVGSDEINARVRLDQLIRRLVLAAGCVAVLAVFQFQTGIALVDRLKPPGLTEHTPVGGMPERGGFIRPPGTAIHPLELVVVLSMVLPLAIYVAMSDKHRKVWVRWFPVAFIAFTIPISVSRSAIVCTVVAMLLFLPALPRGPRRLAYLASLGMTGLVYVMVPGMLGTIVNLFARVSTDDSAASRTNSYDLAFQFIDHAPIFGRGFMTFLPEYRILDNQYLVSFIETGIVGVATLVLLLLTGIVVSWQIRRRISDPDTRLLAAALAASVAAGASSMALFDAFSFPMAGGLIFLVIGLVGALDRLVSVRRLGGARGTDRTRSSFERPLGS